MFVPLLLASLQSPTIVLDPKSTQGTWEGWGTSLCWMGKAFGDREDVADLLFTMKTVKIGDESLPGLGMNIVRYNAGACAWNEVEGRKMVVGRGIQPFRQMEGFWNDPAKGDSGWDWSVDKNQREMMLKAKKRGVNRFELFSNSPMWWMCANDNPSGAPKSTDDNLRTDQTDVFAQYLAKVASQAKKVWGVTFTTVEPFNEPLSSWWDANCKQEGCHFSVEAQRAVLPRLRTALDKEGLRRMKISASDETYVTHAVQAWKGYDDATRALVSQVNVHGYEGPKSPRTELRAVVGNKALWLSEHGGGDPSGLDLAQNLSLDIQNLHPNAWCYWQPLDGGGWGFLNSDVPNAKILHSNPKFFVMAQYTRHIHPGMKILETGDAETVAAYDPKRGKLVVVLVNLSGSPVTRTLDLSRFQTLAGHAAIWRTEPKGLARYDREADVPVNDKSLQLDLLANSVETVEVGG